MSENMTVGGSPTVESMYRLEVDVDRRCYKRVEGMELDHDRESGRIEAGVY